MKSESLTIAPYFNLYFIPNATQGQTPGLSTSSSFEVFTGEGAYKLTTSKEQFPERRHLCKKGHLSFPEFRSDDSFATTRQSAGHQYCMM